MRGALAPFAAFATASLIVAFCAQFWTGFSKLTLNNLAAFLMGQGQSSRNGEPIQWPPANNTYPLATFAGGCFWGTELKFQRIPGVKQTCVGYIGGSRADPSYNAVCSGATGHAEATQVTYDPKEISYEGLVDAFFKSHDPTTKNRQGGDIGTQYRSAIFYHTPEQQQIAEAAFAKVPKATTQIAAAGQFYPAEAYHQQYLEHGGRFGRGQSAAKGCSDPVRCYG